MAIDMSYNFRFSQKANFVYESHMRENVGEKFDDLQYKKM